LACKIYGQSGNCSITLSGYQIFGFFDHQPAAPVAEAAGWLEFI
jgi:hypothetical protein